MITILFFQFVIVVSLVVASRQRLENALPVACFFLVLMPLESRIVIPGLFDFNTMRVTLITLLLLYCSRQDQAIDDPIPLKWLMFLYVGWAILSTVFSLSFATSAKQLISQVLEYFLLYYLFIKIISDVQTIYNIVFAMSLAIGLCCIFGLFEAYAHWSILSIFPSNFWTSHDGGTDPLYIEQGRGLRILATFPHPILFGDALTMSIPLTLYLLSIWEVRWQRGLLWVGALLMFWAIYKTSSRGPWVVTGISCTLLFFIVRNRVRKYLATIAFVLVIILIARPGIRDTIEGLYDSTSDASSPIGSSYMYRGALTTAVTNAATASPERALFGYGLGTFRQLGLDIDFLHEVRHWHTCDNNWDLFLYETGYVGLFLISILLAKPLLIAVQSYRHLPRPENAFSGVLFITLAGFYFSLMTVAGYNWGQQGYMAWILISLTICFPRVLLKDKGLEEQSDEESRGLNEEYELYIA
jgi:hypothetical protein